MDRAKLFWALAGSLGLHALIAISLWPRTPQRPAQALRIVVHAQILPEPEKVLPAAEAAKPIPQPPSPALQAAPRAADALPGAPTATVQPVDPIAQPSTDPVGYLPIDAVDEPATPVGDWIVDAGVLPHGYTLRLVILVWISAGGSIDKWELDSQSGSKAYALKALVDLDRTAVHPAIRNNIAVPSYRRLEMVITND